MPAPLPTWGGVQYVDSAALPTFRTGDGFGVNPGGSGGSGGAPQVLPHVVPHTVVPVAPHAQQNGRLAF